MIVDASNKVRIGKSSVTLIGGTVGWSNFSDGRYKKDIRENIAGLAFINSLRPVTYTVDVKGLNRHYHKKRNQFVNNLDEVSNTEMKKGEEEAGKIVHNGFIAQEVELAAKKVNFEFSGVDKPKTADGLYGLRYAEFVVPLVKAVQEQQQMIDDLKKENTEMKKQFLLLSELRKEIDSLKTVKN